MLHLELTICIFRAAYSDVAKIPRVDMTEIGFMKFQYHAYLNYSPCTNDSKWCWLPRVKGIVEKTYGQKWDQVIELHFKDIDSLCTPRECDEYRKKCLRAIQERVADMAYARLGGGSFIISREELLSGLEIESYYISRWLCSLKRPVSGRPFNLQDTVKSKLAKEWMERLMGNETLFSISKVLQHKFSGTVFPKIMGWVHKRRIARLSPEKWSGLCPFCEGEGTGQMLWDFIEHVRIHHSPRYFFWRNWTFKEQE